MLKIGKFGGEGREIREQSSGNVGWFMDWPGEIEIFALYPPCAKEH
ncbi:MAG: hypothetical protein QF701_02040 [Nitrospinota bacterium]|nr:hypothetical protein [Nitrospinota bacterium]MDP7166531.1 hypothetical protein [Nitrospinota bacterium]MDP7503263.1 hypothetical protein [Nitrospinota bacterium]MDP7663204.1 hypothetical protein [Nitrospinota bacterium]HJP15029.1 hypothetical protein [Nitrospinota bacterium]